MKANPTTAELAKAVKTSETCSRKESAWSPAVEITQGRKGTFKADFGSETGPALKSAMVSASLSDFFRHQAQLGIEFRLKQSRSGCVERQALLNQPSHSPSYRPDCVDRAIF
jgi:hypothetical protein